MDSSQARRRVLFWILGIPAIAAIYFAAAKLGLSMAMLAEQVSLVWPATGFALAAVLLLGYRVWPGIALGALIANATANEPFATACGIALGNTLEAVGGAWLLRRTGFDCALGRLSDVVKLFVFAAGISTTISSTIGVISLSLGGVQPWEAFGSLWWTWWIGDAMGNLVVAPLLLTWAGDKSAPPRRWREALILTVSLSAACLIVFTERWTVHLPGYPLAFAVFPFAIWAALRFGQRGTAAVILIAAGWAVLGAIGGVRLLQEATAHERLLVLQLFMGVNAMTALLLGAAITERRLALEELRYQRECLHVTLEHKDEFLATLAHELRNPLAPISNALQLLRLTDDLTPAVKHMSGIMERQVNHLVRLVDDLLEVSRITRGKIELRKELVDVIAVVANAVETSRPVIEAAGHQLAITLASAPMMLEADAVRLAQVIANLLNNAAKYTERGGQIWLTTRHVGDEAVISVRDTGLGISAEMLPRVFEMFVQVDSTRRRAQGGLGIGLTLARSLVQLHGGRIEAHSDGLGRGSEFVVHLPLISSPAPLATPAILPITSPRSLPVRKILLVDDAEEALDTLAELLATMGQRVRTAVDAASAIEQVRAQRPDVVISDIAMPNIDGYELAQRLRREPGLEGVFLVALTGYGQDSDKRQAMEAGFDYHLIKPANLEALENLLRSMPAPRQPLSLTPPSP